MATISPLTDGKQFLGHDGRKYWIVSRDGKPESKSFMDVVVTGSGADTTVASYGVVLIRFPHNKCFSERDSNDVRNSGRDGAVR